MKMTIAEYDRFIQNALESRKYLNEPGIVPIAGRIKPNKRDKE